MADTPTSLRQLARAAQRTALRLRINETTARVVALLPLPLVGFALALAVLKVHPASQLGIGMAAVGCLTALVVPMVGALVWFARRSPHLGAWKLDRHYGLQGRIANALAFAAEPEKTRTPLMRVAIEDALATVPRLLPRHAVPLQVPRELPLVLLLMVGLAAIASLEVQTVRVLAPPPAVDPLIMAVDDLELFRDLGRELEQNPRDPETLAAARRFNRLLEDVDQRRLDRREVFRRLEELERDLARSTDTENQALEEGLRNVARELERSDLTKPASEALAEPRLSDAEKALRELAEKVKRKQGAPTAAELEKLRKALERAAQTTTERAKAIEGERQRLQEQQRSLLSKEQKGQLSQQDKKELEQKKRQLERLDRQKKQSQAAQSKLSKLDEALAKAAAELAKDRAKAAEGLESAAEDLNRMAGQQLTDKQKQELLKRMQEMREVLRQQGKGGEERARRMARFARKARGQQEEQQGEGGQNQRPSQGQPGKEAGSEQGLRLALGQGGAPIPGGGSPEGQGRDPGTSPGDPAGNARGASGNDPAGAPGLGGKEAGRGHDSNLKGDATALKGKTVDVSAAGVDTGQGSASSETIMGAAQRGFVGGGYRQVYTDYRTVAEQVMSQDQIPPGYRFYVQRYFQLIRPRD